MVGLSVLVSIAMASPAAAVRDLTVTVTTETMAADNFSVAYKLTASN